MSETHGPGILRVQRIMKRAPESSGVQPFTKPFRGEGSCPCTHMQEIHNACYLEQQSLEQCNAVFGNLQFTRQQEHYLHCWVCGLAGISLMGNVRMCRWAAAYLVEEVTTLRKGIEKAEAPPKKKGAAQQPPPPKVCTCQSSLVQLSLSCLLVLLGHCTSRNLHG